MEKGWAVDFSLANHSALRRFQKNHVQEYASCLRNLDKVIMLLDDGHALNTLNRNPGFFRSERKSVFRVGQTGLVGAKETRLYVYPVESEKVVTKESQESDINEAHRTVKSFRKENS